LGVTTLNWAILGKKRKEKGVRGLSKKLLVGFSKRGEIIGRAHWFRNFP